MTAAIDVKLNAINWEGCYAEEGLQHDTYTFKVIPCGCIIKFKVKTILKGI